MNQRDAERLLWSMSARSTPVRMVLHAWTLTLVLMSARVLLDTQVDLRFMLFKLYFCALAIEQVLALYQDS